MGAAADADVSETVAAAAARDSDRVGGRVDGGDSDSNRDSDSEIMQGEAGPLKLSNSSIGVLASLLAPLVLLPTGSHECRLLCCCLPLEYLVALRESPKQGY